ncbi:MAG: hypothetical protein ACOC1X_01395 [Promethearchaeota archaeon]
MNRRKNQINLYTLADFEAFKQIIDRSELGYKTATTQRLERIISDDIPCDFKGCNHKADVRVVKKKYKFWSENYCISCFYDEIIEYIREQLATIKYQVRRNKCGD